MIPLGIEPLTCSSVSQPSSPPRATVLFNIKRITNTERSRVFVVICRLRYSAPSLCVCCPAWWCRNGVKYPNRTKISTASLRKPENSRQFILSPSTEKYKLDVRGFVYRQWKCYWRWQLSGSNGPLLISNLWFEIGLGNSQWACEMHSVNQECSSTVLWIKCLMRNIYLKVLSNNIPLQLWRVKEQ